MKVLGKKTIACGNSLLVDEIGNSLGITLKEQEDLTLVPKNPLDMALSVMVYRNPFQGAAMLFRRSFLKKALPVPEGVNYHDSWFAALACFMDGVSYTDIIVLNYRIHGENQSGIHNKRNRSFVAKRRYDGIYVEDRPILLNSIIKRGLVDSFSKRWIVYWLWQYYNANRNTRIGKFQNRLFFHMYRSAIYSMKE